jgi:PAS domain S-box-containing protein
MSTDPRLILVVEDEPGTALLQRRRLERAGFRVEVAPDVDRALDLLAAHPVDLVTMDYRLGTTTGLELNRRMKIAGFDTPVIIVSGAVDDATVIEAMRAGIRDVVIKTVDYLEHLPDAVRAVLAQVAAVPGSVTTSSVKTRVLVVEDDPGAAALTRNRLERAGYAVDVASTAAAAREIVQRGRAHLAILDERLNGVSGLDVYEQFRADGFPLPAVLVTAYPDQTVTIRALRAGVRDIVPKSAEYLDQLVSAVERVDAQRRLQRRLVESELRLASVIGAAMDAIVLCDEHLRIVLFNRSAEEMFGCEAAQATGEALSRFIPGVDAVYGAGNGGTSATRRRVRMELEGVRHDGARLPLEVSMSDVVVEGRRLLTVIARDISERKRTEAELREADRRKDVFLGMLAHELRNPLAAISTAGEVLHRTVGDGPTQKLTNVIRRQTGALSRMVDDLLDVSRFTLGKIQVAHEPLLLKDVVIRAVDGVREAARRADLRLEVTVSPEPVWVNGDSTRLEQVLANLLNNAVKFTTAGGIIAVSAGYEAGEALISVRDTGVGIDRGLLPHVFDLFVQGDTSLDRSRSGLGIGLALVRQVVRLHGGEVTARSAGPGRGSEFIVRLPGHLGVPRDDDMSGDGADRPPRPLRIVVVDDQPDLADCVALLVEALGHRAEAVYGGEDALAISRREIPDLMLVDIGMPGMTGYELARAIRADPVLCRIRLAALTGYGREEDRIRVLEAGFDLHLTKPVLDSTLREAIEALTPAATKD